MAKVGEIERMVENLVNRGLVAPKFVGRQVGQSLINELSSLDQNIATSRATQANIQSERLSDVRKMLIGQSRGRGGSGSGQASQPMNQSFVTDPTSPFVTSRIGGNGFYSGSLNIAIPTSEGLKVSNVKGGTAEAQAALKNTRKPAPEVNLVTMGGQYKTLMDLRNKLLGATQNPNQVSGFFS